MVEHLHKTAATELKAIKWDPIRLPSKPFPRLTFAEAQELYFSRAGVDDREEPDLSPAAEKNFAAGHVKSMVPISFLSLTGKGKSVLSILNFARTTLS